MSPEIVTKKELSQGRSVKVNIIRRGGYGLSLEQINDGWQFNFRDGRGISDFLEELSDKMQSGPTQEEKERSLKEMKRVKEMDFKEMSIRFSNEEVIGVEQCVFSDGNFGHNTQILIRFANKKVVEETYKMLLPKEKPKSKS